MITKHTFSSETSRRNVIVLGSHVQHTRKRKNYIYILMNAHVILHAIKEMKCHSFKQIRSSA